MRKQLLANLHFDKNIYMNLHDLLNVRRMAPWLSFPANLIGIDPYHFQPTGTLALCLPILIYSPKTIQSGELTNRKYQIKIKECGLALTSLNNSNFIAVH